MKKYSLILITLLWTTSLLNASLLTIEGLKNQEVGLNDSIIIKGEGRTEESCTINNYKWELQDKNSKHLLQDTDTGTVIFTPAEHHFTSKVGDIAFLKLTVTDDCGESTSKNMELNITSNNKNLQQKSKKSSVVWQSTAMSCVPSSTSIEEAKYITTAGRVKRKNGQYGAIALICPVSTPLKTGYYNIRGMFKSVTANKYASFQLRKAHNVTGAVSTVLNANYIQRKANKNHFRSLTSAKKYVNFDFWNYTYWVQITAYHKPILSVHLYKY